jgi:hypothetical protein
MSAQNRLIAVFMVAISCTLMAPGDAYAQDITEGQIDAAIRSNVCPSNLARIKHMSWEDGCGERFHASNPKMRECRSAVDELNRKINAYNKFVNSCRTAKLKRRYEEQHNIREARRREAEQRRQTEQATRQQKRNTEPQPREGSEEWWARKEEEQRAWERAQQSQAPAEKSWSERLAGFCTNWAGYESPARCRKCLNNYYEYDSFGNRQYCANWLKNSPEKLCALYRTHRNNSEGERNLLRECDKWGF